MLWVTQNEPYKYPDVYVCLNHGFGCDEQEKESECVVSAFETEGGHTAATFNPNADNSQEIGTRASDTNTTVSTFVLLITPEQGAVGDGWL